MGSISPDQFPDLHEEDPNDKRNDHIRHLGHVGIIEASGMTGYRLPPPRSGEEWGISWPESSRSAAHKPP